MPSVLLVSIFLVNLLAEVLAAPQIYTHLYRVPHASPAFGTHRIVHLGPFGPVIPNVYHLPPKAPAVSSLATSTVPSITMSTGRQGLYWPDSIFQTTSAPTVSPPTTSTFPSTTTSTDKIWTATVKACIAGHNNKEITGPSFEECKILCENETSFSCASVDYYPPENLCQLSTDDNGNEDYMEPCYSPYDDSNIYSQIIDAPAVNSLTTSTVPSITTSTAPAVNSLTTSTVPSITTSTDGDLVLIGGQYLTFSKEYVSSWDQAMERCKALNARLAVIDDPHAFHTYMYKNYRGRLFALGALDNTTEGTWNWIDGSPLQHNFPWGRGEPNDEKHHTEEGEDCLGWGLNNYNDFPCSYGMHYVCEHDIPECSSPWFHKADQCFLVVDEESDWLSWAGARDHCKTLAPEADLAKPKDLKVLDGLVQHIFDMNHQGDDYNPTDFHYWLGGTDFTTEGEWLWVNNDTIPFTDRSGWYPGEPNNSGGHEDCLEIRPYYHAIITLNDVKCHKKQGFVCERH